MKNNFFVLIIALTQICCAQADAPKISVDHATFDFGKVKHGEIVKHSFVIKNEGGSALIIKKVNASCGCTAANPEKRELSPGESTKINVEFHTEGRSGLQKKYIYIESNDSTSREIRLAIVGEIIAATTDKESVKKAPPLIYFEKSLHDFGAVKEGDKVEYSFVFWNNGGSPLEIEKIETSCGCTAATLKGNIIQPGEKSFLNVVYDTKNRSGKSSKRVSIFSNDPLEKIKTVIITADIRR